MERNHHGEPLTSDITRTLFVTSEVETIHAPKFSIEVVRGTPQGLKLDWDRPSLRCGTASDNDVVLDDDTVSRHHFRIDVEPRGFRLRDLNSKNGVVVEDLVVRDAYLPPSCKLRVGDCVLRFRVAKEIVDHEFTRNPSLGDMVGKSPQMRHLFALAQRVAASEATVLVEGESGTGKELLARALHDFSRRKDKPFEVVDCSSIPENIIESELFGHVRGAFTGAVANRKGLIESAHRGTLFLDEIGELPLTLQGKILRLLERKEIRAVGDDNFKTVDIRILAATNRNLREEVERGNFREDLYFRLAVMKLRIPPLREHPEDIQLLVDHFLTQFSQRDKAAYTLPHSFLGRLTEYDFPGNVRELRNLLERSCILADGSTLHPELPSQLRPAATGTDWGDALTLPYKEAKDRLNAQFERVYWERLLNECGGNISEAARRGGIHRKSLEYLLRKFREMESES